MRGEERRECVCETVACVGGGRDGSKERCGIGRRGHEIAMHVRTRPVCIEHQRTVNTGGMGSIRCEPARQGEREGNGVGVRCIVQGGAQTGHVICRCRETEREQAERQRRPEPSRNHPRLLHRETIPQGSETRRAGKIVGNQPKRAERVCQR